MTESETEGVPTSLYRLFNDAGGLLYVGISMRVARRVGEHASGKPWWPEVANISVERFPSRDDALTAERSAIKSERPRYNVAGRLPQGMELLRLVEAGEDDDLLDDPADLAARVASRIRRLRVALGFSPVEVAGLAGLSTEALAAIEETETVSLAELFALARALGVDAALLVGSKKIQMREYALI